MPKVVVPIINKCKKLFFFIVIKLMFPNSELLLQNLDIFKKGQKLYAEYDLSNINNT